MGLLSMDTIPDDAPTTGTTTGESPQRAGERVRTVDNDVGNVVLYQLSYARINQSVALYSVPYILQDGGKNRLRCVSANRQEYVLRTFS